MRLPRRRDRDARADADAPVGPWIGLCGPFDVTDYVALLVPRIVERELLRRLPLARVDVYAPGAVNLRTPLDGGYAVIRLGDPSPHRRRQLAERHDLILVAKGFPTDVIDADLCGVAVIPEVTALARRAFPDDVLRRRLEYLRALGSFPQSGRPVFVDSCAAAPEEAAVRFPGESMVSFALSDPDASPPITIHDLTAAISAAQAVVGEPRLAPVAAAFEVPFYAAPELNESTAPADLATRADGELDALAAIAEQTWARRAAGDGTVERLLQLTAQWEERYRALAAAYEARGERLVSERLRFAEIVERLEAAAEGVTVDDALRIAELENAVFTAQAAETAARLELERLAEDRG